MLPWQSWGRSSTLSVSLFQCTTSCGGGSQKRTVHCIPSENSTTEDQDQCFCDHQARPPEFQNCNQQACRKSAGRWLGCSGGAGLQGWRLRCVRPPSQFSLGIVFWPLGWTENLNAEEARQQLAEEVIWFNNWFNFDWFFDELLYLYIWSPVSEHIYADGIPRR